MNFYLFSGRLIVTARSDERYFKTDGKCRMSGKKEVVCIEDGLAEQHVNTVS